MDIDSTKSDKRYEVVVKHYSAGVLHKASFKTLNRAHAFLLARWNELPVDSGRTQIECGAAIYDKHESRKRLSTLGAAYLVNEIVP
ncbi:MAG TPA: hypothetical protein VFU08_05120 [Candidatus Udaeobacter sp.]|jgi:hypothetical protein|nr:hypothetical protein [Candidatus Udaeobacter sp.]